MNDLDIQTVMDLLHDVCVILVDQESKVWNKEFLDIIERTQIQILEQYEWEQQ